MAAGTDCHGAFCSPGGVGAPGRAGGVWVLPRVGWDPGRVMSCCSIMPGRGHSPEHVPVHGPHGPPSSSALCQGGQGGLRAPPHCSVTPQERTGVVERPKPPLLLGADPGPLPRNNRDEVQGGSGDRAGRGTSSPGHHPGHLNSLSPSYFSGGTQHQGRAPGPLW